MIIMECKGKESSYLKQDSGFPALLKIAVRNAVANNTCSIITFSLQDHWS